MDKYYLEILKKIEENGFVAYIVGGFVRDKILGINSKDIDIITNATPKDLKRIWKNIKTYEEYGAVKLQIKNCIIDITTFRKELSYKNGKPNSILYINSLEEDLKRRDFLMNTLCMDSDENIIDLLDGKNDIENKIIRTIKDPKIEFEEDPSRILRALRFMSTLDFKLDNIILNYILSHKETLNKINITKRKEELDKLFKTKKVSNFLTFIKKYNLENQIGIKSNNFVETNTVIGIWSQLELTIDFPFNKQEKEQIKKIKRIIKNKKITKMDLYKEGNFICNVAAEILKIDSKELNLIYTNLPIKGIIDIEINCEEICNLLNIKPGKELGLILKSLEKEIIEGKLQNKKKDIIKWLKDSEVEYVRFKE